MPANKDAYHRYILIDRCLTRKNKSHFSAVELLDYIRENSGLEISERTLQADIREMRESETLGFNAPIVFDRKFGGYTYTEEGFSIGRHVSLSEQELESLEFATGVLDSFRNVAMVSTFRDAIDKIVAQMTLRKRLSSSEYDSFILSEEPVFVEGLDWLDKFVHAIKEKVCLEISYLKFNQDELSHYTFHPLLLKEYQGRWYAIGMTEKNNRIITLGLDRIKSVETSEIPYRYTDFDKTNYFKNVIGITVPPEQKAKKIILSFTPLKGHYIKTQHLHASQKIIKDNKKEFQISLQLIPTYELKAYILSCGSECKVVQPKELADEIKEAHQKASLLYNTKK